MMLATQSRALLDVIAVPCPHIQMNFRISRIALKWILEHFVRYGRAQGIFCNVPWVEDRATYNAGQHDGFLRRDYIFSFRLAFLSTKSWADIE